MSPQQLPWDERLLFEKSKEGANKTTLPELDVPRAGNLLPRDMVRGKLELPSLPEIEVIRHYTRLSQKNHSVDIGFYPLGSCTMKYNPKVNEAVARLPGFTELHPFVPESHAQGSLRLMYELERLLAEITGMNAITLQPAAGAQGELTGVLMMKAYFDAKGESRSKILIPDSAHGTNPASVVLSGFESVEIPSNKSGLVDIGALEKAMDSDVVGMMLTNPNTHGLFEKDILDIAKIIHRQGGLLYGDGANANALTGVARFGDLGFDVIHLNLHKTFSTPHGGGGPGSGPVGVGKTLEPYLPKPRIGKKGEHYFLDWNKPKSIGKIKAFWGNFGVMVRAYAYIRSLGPDGLRNVAETAVLNANYLKWKLKKNYHLQYNARCMHEFILSDQDMPNDIKTNDIAKRLLDFRMHAPTIYFPLTVKGAMMIEPTETESKERLDEFIEVMERIAKEAADNPDRVKNAPWTTPVKRLDGVKAAREPVLRWKQH